MSKKNYLFLLVLFSFSFIFLSSSCDKLLKSTKTNEKTQKQTNSQKQNYNNQNAPKGYKVFETEKFSLLIPEDLASQIHQKPNNKNGYTYTWGNGSNGLFIQADYFMGNPSLTTTTWVNKFKELMQKRGATILYDNTANNIPDAHKLAVNMKVQNTGITSYTIMTKRGDKFFMFQFIVKDEEYPKFKDVINYLQDNVKLK